MRISDWSSDVCSSDLNLDLPIPLPKIEAFRLRGGADREMTIPELFVAGKDSSQPEQTRLESRANFHFRIVEVMSMFLIPLIAVALAVPPKRSTSSLGVFLSIVMLVTQHKIRSEEHTSELQSLM